MKLSLFILIVIALASAGCATMRPAADPAAAFLDHYRPLCGEAFEGRSNLVDLGENHPLENARLLMIVDECREDEVRVRFFVDADRSRTWIIRRTEKGLHLSHDHRYPDGSEYSQNLYGGYADERLTPLKAFFPADERTVRDRPAREINVWSKEFDPDGQRYFYRLYLRGELRYEAEFDLRRPGAAES